jgi:hypothetical protein
MTKHQAADKAIADYDRVNFSGIRTCALYVLAVEAALQCSLASCDTTLTSSARERYHELSRQFAAIL